MFHPTPYPDLNTVLHELLQSVQAILDDNFVGMYLQGSFAVGDFDRHSDADFIVVIHRELSDSHVAALQAMHRRLYDLPAEWAKHLEGAYFPRATLRDYGQSGSELWFLDHGSRELAQSDHDNTVVVRWILRETGVVLAGPHPLQLIEPIPVAVLRREILATINDWGEEILAQPERIDNHFYQTFAVLSYCRMWHDLYRGTVGSKRAGAEWAKGVLDPSWTDLIDRAWAGRPDPARSVRRPADEDDLERTLEFIREVIRESNTLAAEMGLA